MIALVLLNPSCDRDPRSSTPLHFGRDFVELLHRHPNAIALVAGHTHENQIDSFEDPDGGGGFWQITSPAIADWPPQHRLIEVMDNRDGTLSIFGTMLDHVGPVEAPPAGTSASSIGLRGLGSIGRTLDYNDPQEGGLREPTPPDGELAVGKPTDRNVELLIRDPRVSKRCRGEPATIVGKGKRRLRGTKGRDVVVGGSGKQRISGRGGKDLICAGRAKDRIKAGGGKDRLYGGLGNDRIRARGGGRDKVRCGGGRRDVATVDRRDRVRGCERTRRGG